MRIIEELMEIWLNEVCDTVMISFDKTQLTRFWAKVAYPVYLTIGNIPKHICQKPLYQGQILLTYLPTTKLEHVLNQASRCCTIMNIFHACLKFILSWKGWNWRRVNKEWWWSSLSVTNFIWPYLHQFSIDSHGLNGYGKPLKRPFDRYQSRLEAISNGRDIRQINW